MAITSRRPKLEYTVDSPLNREPPVKELISSFITEEGAYDRNHGPVPYLDRESYSVKVDGAVRESKYFSIHELSHSFPQHTVTCALQCAGNRRHTMRTFLKEVDGIDWGDGAVMNCRWRGPRLRDVLLRAGVEADDGSLDGEHVAFACYHTKVQEDSWYGGSIELERGMSEDGEVILALEMNSKPLPVNHGAPVRVIAPGIAGARCVKWLERITVQSTESENFYQKRDYKILPPEATDKEKAKNYWDATPAIQDMPINSVIGSLQNGDTIKLDTDGMTEIRGYALPQGASGPVINVEVSIDEGATWRGAELMGDGGKWSWVLWKVRMRLETGERRRILSRATDKEGNVQCANPRWNLRGVAYNGYGESRNLTVFDCNNA